MKLGLIICVLAATTAALAQTTNKPSLKTPAERAASPDNQNTPTLQKRDEPVSEIPLDQPVITVQGLCPVNTAPATNAAVPSTKECSIVMTREQFGNLVKSFNTNNQPVSTTERRKLAESYVDILIYAEAAKSAGVENSAAYTEIMRVLRLRTLADLYLTGLSEQLRNPSQAEMEAYYQANQAKFESARLGRIFIPKSSPDVQAPLEQKNAYPQKAAAVADEMQARATKGEPIDRLQKEAYTTLGINVTPPNTEMNVPRHGVLPAKLEQAVFSHNAGEVFRGDDANGFIIYHVDQKAPAPLETVKDEVLRDMVRSKMDEKLKELKAPVHTTLEEKYFGPAVAAKPAATLPGQTAQPK